MLFINFGSVYNLEFIVPVYKYKAIEYGTAAWVV